MAGLYTLSLIIMASTVGDVYSYCNQMVYSDGHGQFDGYMGLVSHFEELDSRSLLACDRRCVLVESCQGFTFDPDTNRCHLFNYTLTDTVGLTPSINAVYYSKSEILPGTFICPLPDGQYHYVDYAGDCIQVKAVHTYRNYDDAAAECEVTGGRLFLLNNVDKRSLFITLSGCPGWRVSYSVDGNNENATDYNAVDAFTTKYGDVVPVTSPLWSGSGSWNYYYPTTQHCLYFHSSHFHTSTCTSSRYYLCEK